MVAPAQRIHYDAFTPLPSLSKVQNEHLAQGIAQDFFKIVTGPIFNEREVNLNTTTYGEFSVVEVENYLSKSRFRCVLDIFKALESMGKRSKAIEVMGELTGNVVIDCKDLLGDKKLFDSTIYDLIQKNYASFARPLVIKLKENEPESVKKTLKTHKSGIRLGSWLNECKVIDFICAFYGDSKYIEHLHKFLLVSQPIPKRTTQEFIDDALNPIHCINDPEDLKGDFYGISEEILDENMEKYLSMEEFKEIFFRGLEKPSGVVKNYYADNLFIMLKNSKLDTFFTVLKNSFPVLKLKFLNSELSVEDFSQVPLRMLLISLKHNEDRDCISLIKDKIDKKNVIIEEEQNIPTQDIPTPAMSFLKIANHLTKHFSPELQNVLRELNVDPQSFVEEYIKRTGLEISITNDQSPINEVLNQPSLTIGELRNIAMSCIGKKLDLYLEKVVTL